MNMSPVIPHIYGAKGGGKGGGKGDARVAQESPNTLQSRATARLLDLLCAGEIKGPVDGSKSLFLDDTPLQNADGTYNFEGVTWDFRTGMPDQDHMPGFSEIESEVGVNVQVKYGKPITRSITDQELDAVRVTLRFPAMYHQDMSNGDILPTSASVAIEISTDGGPFQRVVTDDLSGKCTSPYERAYRIDLPQGSRWDLRVVRLSADSTSSALANDTWWQSYTRIIDAKMVYPDSAYVGVAVDSQLFGSNVPQRAYDIYGKIIQVPSNYDPATRAYSGLWDGTFKRAYSNNPAWCLYDVLTDPVNGLGQELTAERIDKWGLYSIGQYCDELVDDGLGGKEPRFTFNGVINTQEDALNAIAAMAGAFRTIVYFSAGMVYFSQDRPTPYKRLLTPANVVNGMFNYEGTGQKARHSVALISWLDPGDGFKTAIETVEDPDSILEYGWRTTDEIALGCTSRGQAYRHGAMLLDAEKNCTTTCSFATGLDCADIMPGDVIAIADPSHAGARSGGRIAAISELGATLDAPFPFTDDQTYSLVVTLPDNAMYEIPLVNPGMETAIVEFAQPAATLPRIGSVFTVLASNLAPQLFRVMGVEEGEGITFNFSCLQYDPTKHDRVEKGISLPQTPTTLLPTGPLPPPYNLTYAEYLYLKSGLSPMAGLTISWSYTDPRAMGYEVEYQRPGFTGFEGKVIVSSLSLDMDIQEQGIYIFRVRAVDGIGRYSNWATLIVNAQALWVSPSDVRNFLGQVQGDLLHLTWDMVPDLHLDHYEMRFTADQDNPRWDTAQTINNHIGKTTTSLLVPLQTGTFMIKAVSIKGIPSVNATALYNGISPDLSLLNVVEDLIQHPAWAGEKDRTDERGDILYLARQNTGIEVLDVYTSEDVYAESDIYRLIEPGEYYPIGYYYFDPIFIDLSAIYDTRLIPILKYDSTTLSSDVYAVDDVYALPNVYDTNSSTQYKIYLEYSITQETPEAPSGLDPYASADIYAEPDVYTYTPISWSAWVPFVEPLTVRARGYRFRLVLESLDGETSPAVFFCQVTLDMPDRIVSVDDFVVLDDPAGHYFPFTPPFKNSPAISAPMIQDGTEGDRYRITEKSRSGFRLFLYDVETQEPISRSVDWIAKGYGAELIAPGG
ncbi:phage tail protein [Desulfovibrio sp. OttesenSCG-928-G11]|nr:phage tail protein [Desulfovibrio sp. OttesenSCG-928-G11]